MFTIVLGKLITRYTQTRARAQTNTRPVLNEGPSNVAVTLSNAI